MTRLPYIRMLYQSANGRWVLVSERPALIQESVDGYTAYQMSLKARDTGRWMREVWWYRDPRKGWVRDFAITYAPDGSRGVFST